MKADGLCSGFASLPCQRMREGRQAPFSLRVSLQIDRSMTQDVVQRSDGLQEVAPTIARGYQLPCRERFLLSTLSNILFAYSTCCRGTRRLRATGYDPIASRMVYPTRTYWTLLATGGKRSPPPNRVLEVLKRSRSSRIYREATPSPRSYPAKDDAGSAGGWYAF
jgi:hypothetical protein